LCTSVQVLVNLMKTRDWYIGGGLLRGRVSRRESNEDEQRKGKSVHRISPSMMGNRSIAQMTRLDEDSPH
jgi:hypothetical protein